MTSSLAVALRYAAAMQPERRRKRKPRKWPRPAWPNKERLQYFKVLIGMVERVQDVVRATLFPALPHLLAAHNAARPEDEAITYEVKRLDATGGDVDSLFDELRTEAEAAVPVPLIEMEAQANALRVNTWHANQLQKQVQQVIKVNLFDDVAGLAEHLDVFVSDNVSLVKSLAHGQLDDLKGIVMRGARQGLHHTVVAEQIEQRFQMPKKRAALIATDQIGKLNGELNQLRQQRLGVKRYRWSSSQDERVRPRHRALNGTIQEWAKPPVTDERTGERAHPGQPIRCRCQPIPIIDDVLVEAGLIAPEDVELGMPPRTTPSVGPVPGLPRPPPANLPPTTTPQAQARAAARAAATAQAAAVQAARAAAEKDAAKVAAKATARQAAEAAARQAAEIAAVEPSARLGPVAEAVFGRKLTDSELDELFGMRAQLPPGFALRVTAVKEDARLKFSDVRIIGEILNKKGENVASLSRSYYRDKQGRSVVDHMSFFIHDDHQNLGLGRAVFNAQIDAYERLGVVKNVLLDAAVVGRYVWTKAGFEWTDPAMTKKILGQLKTVIAGKVGRGAATKIMSEVKTPQDVAGLVVDGERVGKEFLIGFDELIPMSQEPRKIKRL